MTPSQHGRAAIFLTMMFDGNLEVVKFVGQLAKERVVDWAVAKLELAGAVREKVEARRVRTARVQSPS